MSLIKHTVTHQACIPACKTKLCCNCGTVNAGTQHLCAVCMTSTWAYDTTELVCNVLLANDWTLMSGFPDLATKRFPTVVGLKQGCVNLNAGDKFNRTLSGVYESEGRNILEPHGVLIPRTANANDVTRIAMHFARRVEKAIAASYAARLLN